MNGKSVGRTQMICFRIKLNDSAPCLAGVGDAGVLTAIVDWVRSDPEEGCAPGKHFIEKPRERINLHVGGLAKDEFQDWLNTDLKVGDRVAIEIVEANTPDQPTERKPGSSAKNSYFTSQQDHKDHLIAELAQVERAMAESGTPQRCSFCGQSASPIRPLVAAASHRGNICGECAAVVLTTLQHRSDAPPNSG